MAVSLVMTSDRDRRRRPIESRKPVVRDPGGMLQGWSSTRTRGAVCSAGNASARCSSGCWIPRATATAPCSSCTETPASARPRCSSTRSRRARIFASFGPRASKGRWSSTTRRCNSSARRSSSSSSISPILSVTRWASPSASAPDRRRARFLSGSRSSASSPKRPSSSRSCASSTTRSGSTAHRPERSRSWRAACWRRGSRSRSRRVRWAVDWPASRSSASSRSAAGMHGRCWSPSSPARLDESVLERIVAETGGNPLALLELPRGLTPGQLAGGFGLPAALPLSSGIEQSFTRRLARLPRDARRLLLLAAAEPVGDPALLWRAAQQLGIPETAAHARRVGRLADGGRCGGVPSSARALGGVRGGRAERAARGSPRAGGRDRSADRPGSPRVASGAGGVRARRRGGRRARALGGAGAGARRLRRCCRLPRARGHADTRPRPPCAARAGRGSDEVPGGRARRRARSALVDGGRRARRARSRASRIAAGADRIRLDARQRRAHAAARGRPPARRRSLRRSPARRISRRCRRRCSRDGWRRRAQARSTWRWPRRPRRGRPSSRGLELLLDGLATFFSESYEAAVPILRRAHDAFDVSDAARERAAALEVARDRLVHPPLGRRALGGDLRTARADRPGDRRARRASARAEPARLRASLRGRADDGGVARRRDPSGDRGDRQQPDAVRRRGTRRATRPRARGDLADRGKPRGRDAARRGNRALGARLGPGGAVQRPRPLRRGSRGGASGRRVSARPQHVELGHGRVDRGRGPSRNTRAGREVSLASRGDGRGERDGLGPRGRGALGGALGGRSSEPRSSTSRRSIDSAGRGWRSISLALTFSTANG